MTHKGDRDLPEQALRQLKVKAFGVQGPEHPLEIVIMLLLHLPIHQDIADVQDGPWAPLQSLSDAALKDCTEVFQPERHLHILMQPQGCHHQGERPAFGVQFDVMIGLHQM